MEDGSRARRGCCTPSPQIVLCAWSAGVAAGHGVPVVACLDLMILQQLALPGPASPPWGPPHLSRLPRQQQEYGARGASRTPRGRGNNRAAGTRRCVPRPFSPYNSPLRSVQVSVYQMRKLRSHSWKVTEPGFVPTSVRLQVPHT